MIFIKIVILSNISLKYIYIEQMKMFYSNFTITNMYSNFLIYIFFFYKFFLIEHYYLVNYFLYLIINIYLINYYSYNVQIYLYISLEDQIN